MTRRIASRRPTTARVTPCRWCNVIETCRLLVKDLFDPYRPERHYMRGPGPKWHEKHAYATVRQPGPDFSQSRRALA